MCHRLQYLVRSYFYATLMTSHPRSHLMFDSLLTIASFTGPLELRLIKKQLQEDLTKLEHWADTWGMKFNPSKCSVRRVKRPRAKEIASDYQLKGVTFEKVSSTYPTYESASVRTWNGGITYKKIASKANSTLGFMRRNLKLKETFQWFSHFRNTVVMYGIHTGKVMSIN